MAPKGVRPSLVGGLRDSFWYSGTAPNVALLDFFFLAFFGPRPIILSIMDAIVALVARRRRLAQCARRGAVSRAPNGL